MIVINRGESNTFVLTLLDCATYSSPEFLMVLHDKSLRVTQKFFISDISTSSSYSKFSLFEGTDETIPKGDYTYKVYEKANQDNEDIPSDGFILETGILRAKEDTITKVSYSRTDASIGYGD